MVHTFAKILKRNDAICVTKRENVFLRFTKGVMGLVGNHAQVAYAPLHVKRNYLLGPKIFILICKAVKFTKHWITIENPFTCPCAADRKDYYVHF